MIAINTGKLLTDYCNRKRIYKSGLARVSGLSYQLVLRILKEPKTSLSNLLKISYALEHNFFMDIACQLPANFTTDAPIDSSAAIEIEGLKEKIKELEAEKKILLEVVRS